VATTRARHHLSPELAGAEHTTLGGALGAGASGLDRLRYGPLRHQVLGLLALHADGSLVKSGGAW
jgi:FAD/FMN-containing dehydrogenase